MASSELYTPQADRFNRTESEERLKQVKDKAFWDSNSPMAQLLCHSTLLPQENALEKIEKITVTEQQLQGYLFTRYPAIANRYEVQEAIQFAIESRAGNKERRDTSLTFEAHLSVATILATHFYKHAMTDQKIVPAVVITALLHDCIEDGDIYTASEIAQHFGYPIAANVVLLSKKGNYLYVSDSYKAVKNGIRQGIQTMRNEPYSNLRETTSQDTWPEIDTEDYMARLKESGDLKLQVIKLADRAANLLSDWHSVVQPDNEALRAKYTQKILEYTAETRNFTLQPFMEDKRLDYAVRYNLNACYHIERRLLLERANGTFKKYYEDWCLEQEQIKQSILHKKANPNRPF